MTACKQIQARREDIKLTMHELSHIIWTQKTMIVNRLTWWSWTSVYGHQKKVVFVWFWDDAGCY